MSEPVAVETDAAAVPAPDTAPEATTATEPVKDTGTLATGDAAETVEPKADEGYWKDDWRERFAKGDEKLLKRLQRFTSPDNVLSAWRDAEKKITSGQYKRSLPEDASPEEVAAWRKESGIPDDPKGYSLDLSGGKVVGDQDKPALEKILAAAHSANVPQSGVSSIVDAYYDMQEEQAAKRQLADAAFKRSAEDALRAEWGADYRVNGAQIDNLIATYGSPELPDLLFAGRTADNQVVGNHPEVLKFLANLSRELNPVPTMVPSNGRTVTETISDRLDAIREMQRKGDPRYWSEKIQAEELQLLEAQTKHKGRAA
jgi:hypothetical protein